MKPLTVKGNGTNGNILIKKMELLPPPSSFCTWKDNHRWDEKMGKTAAQDISLQILSSHLQLTWAKGKENHSSFLYSCVKISVTQPSFQISGKTNYILIHYITGIHKFIIINFHKSRDPKSITEVRLCVGV